MKAPSAFVSPIKTHLLKSKHSQTLAVHTCACDRQRDSVCSSSVGEQGNQSSGTLWVAAAEDVATKQHKRSHSALRVTSVSGANIPESQP